eukprot:1928357-Rhodomonas_salina.1
MILRDIWYRDALLLCPVLRESMLLYYSLSSTEIRYASMRAEVPYWHSAWGYTVFTVDTAYR